MVALAIAVLSSWFSVLSKETQVNFRMETLLKQTNRIHIHDQVASWDLALHRVLQHCPQGSVQPLPAFGLEHEVVAVVALQAHDGRCRRTHDTQPFALVFLKPLS